MSGHMEVWLCVQYPASHTRCVCEGWAGPLIKALHITGWRTLMPQAGSQIHPSVGRDLLTWVLSTLYSIYSLHDSYWHWTTTYVYTVFQCPSLRFNASNSFSGRDARFCVHSDNISIILPHLLNVWLEYTGARSESHGGHFQTISRSQREIFFFLWQEKKPLNTRLPLCIQCQTRSTPWDSLCTQCGRVKALVGFWKPWPRLHVCHDKYGSRCYLWMLLGLFQRDLVQSSVDNFWHSSSWVEI